MKFTINRSTWRCGRGGEYKHGIGVTELLNPEGYMCCLGQVCEQLGVGKDLIERQPHPGYVHFNQENLLCRSSGYVTPLSIAAMQINDNSNTTRESKEEALTELFNSHGHYLEFIGNYNDSPQQSS